MNKSIILSYGKNENPNLCKNKKENNQQQKFIAQVLSKLIEKDKENNTEKGSSSIEPKAEEKVLKENQEFILLKIEVKIRFFIFTQNEKKIRASFWWYTKLGKRIFKICNYSFY